MKFSLYFLGFCKAEDIPQDEDERTEWTFRQVSQHLDHETSTHVTVPPTGCNIGADPQLGD
jgi:hypothetical protein